ncbi:predicted protein [Verticillium alfalfae VaMs.102]|uniref:Predicted protein n=1 Tax=Verticillium alfalfae (strain VaMs.102 / ATCC MYA-4576 / FGSC 10136) TaxID=526221 RepID=C9SYW1_VERA1|nr:predicted protein [Verticillium alfalfae VaMs.102]EEY23976.1 predicted protein [Verticillium alfalfae VaMs.102]
MELSTGTAAGTVAPKISEKLFPRAGALVKRLVDLAQPVKARRRSRGLRWSTVLLTDQDRGVDPESTHSAIIKAIAGSLRLMSPKPTTSALARQLSRGEFSSSSTLLTQVSENNCQDQRFARKREPGLEKGLPMVDKLCGGQSVIIPWYKTLDIGYAKLISAHNILMAMNLGIDPSISAPSVNIDRGNLSNPQAKPASTPTSPIAPTPMNGPADAAALICEGAAPPLYPARKTDLLHLAHRRGARLNLVRNARGYSTGPRRLGLQVQRRRQTVKRRQFREADRSHGRGTGARKGRRQRVGGLVKVKLPLLRRGSARCAPPRRDEKARQIRTSWERR